MIKGFNVGQTKLYILNKRTGEKTEMDINNFQFNPAKQTNLESLEDQLCDIGIVLDDIAEDVAYNSNAYWDKQVVDLTKLYLADMIAQQRAKEEKLTAQYLEVLVRAAIFMAKKSVATMQKELSNN